MSHPPNLVLQLASEPEVVTCTGFLDLPQPYPCQIAIVPAQTAGAAARARELFVALRQTLLHLAPGVSEATQMPCHGLLLAANECRAFQAPQTRSLLVLVGDAATPIVPSPLLSHWLAMRPKASIMPVFPGRQPFRPELLPEALRVLNVAFWDRKVDEVVADVLALAGLAPPEYRLFISYRRSDASPLALQLFDALGRANCDVFLDRFSIEPSVDFQRRLTQELADKTMVLLLESEHLLESDWILHEIAFAKANHLGMFALHLPGGPYLPDIDQSARIELDAADLPELGADKLFRVMKQLKLAHHQALVRRRHFILAAMRDALLQQGVVQQSLGTEGLLHVKTPRKDYALRLADRPPDWHDLHAIHTACPVPGPTQIVVGLTSAIEPARAQRLGWLSHLCAADIVNESEIPALAVRIAQGA